MFKKEESNKKRRMSLENLNYKRIGSIIVTTTLIALLTSTVKAEVTDCNHGQVEYYERLYDYKQEREYDQKIVLLYNDSQINIGGVLYPIDKFFITYTQEGENHDFHLMNIKSEYTDILTNSKEKYSYDSIVRFRDTTAFINLINSDGVLIDEIENTITIIDLDKALSFIENWDGMLHNVVPETDAVENKDLLRR